VIDKPKPKPKRARTANVEVLLQSSIDGELRRTMGDIRGCWSDGKNSSMPIWDGLGDCDVSTSYKTPAVTQMNDGASMPENDPIVTVPTPSPEEKALAMELLHLIPPKLTNDDRNSNGILDTTLSMRNIEYKKLANQVQCLACLGRFVLHSCGLREKPIDYDEIARLEQEEKEREEEEKQKERILKRRQAEAKRRETRKKKKDAEQSSIQYHDPNHMDVGWEQNRYVQGVYTDPLVKNDDQRGVFRNEHIYKNERSEKGEIYTHMECIDDTSKVRYETAIEVHEYSELRQWDRPSQNGDSIHDIHGSIRINGTEVQPSTSLHPMDALEALAGLAGSMAKPVPIQENVHNFKVVHTSTDDDPFNRQTQLNGYSNNINFDERERNSFSGNVQNKTLSGVVDEYGTMDRHYTDSSLMNDLKGGDTGKGHVAPIAHVDYRDGRTVVSQTDTSLQLNQAPMLSPSLHKPIIDPSIDQSVLLTEIAESTVNHRTHHHQHSPNSNTVQNEDTCYSRLSTLKDNEAVHGPIVDQSPEAEALLALAYSASPKATERPTVQWSPNNDRYARDQMIFSYSPSSQQQPCFGSTTTSTHAIVVSQFLQQPMAASLTNATYTTLNDNNNIVSGNNDVENMTSATGSDSKTMSMDDTDKIISSSST
jgi:hypothetical protein